MTEIAGEDPEKPIGSEIENSDLSSGSTNSRPRTKPMGADLYHCPWCGAKKSMVKEWVKK